VSFALSRSESDVMNRLIPCIRKEYQEQPGLALTLPQAARLWNTDLRICEAAFDALISALFLTLRADGRYARRDAWHQSWCPWCGVAA
jgi:hypothetical protein